MHKMLHFMQPKVAGLVAILALAFLGGCSCNNCVVPFNSGSSLPPGVLPCTASGTGAIGVICTSGKTYAFVGKGNAGSMTVEQIDISSGAKAAVVPRVMQARVARPAARSVHAAVITHTYTLTFLATECSSDELHLRVACAGFGSAQIADIDASAQTDTEYPTGAKGTLRFTGGSCTICDVAYDPTDNAYIILVPDKAGGTVGDFQRWGESSHTQIGSSVVVGDPNENWGYDYVKNWVFTPEYNESHTHPEALQLIDFTTSTLYTSSTTFPMIDTPDAGNVDVSTHVAVTPNEFNPPDIFTTADLGTVTLNSPSAGMFTVSASSQTLTIMLLGTCGADDTDIATDSVLHLTFVTGEFCDLGEERMGFVLLPTTSSGLAISDYAFVKVPNTPDAVPWDAALDPHPVAAFNDPVNCPDCAIIVNREVTWLGVIDLNKLKAAPRSASDAHAIDPTYDLQANSVLKYYAI